LICEKNEITFTSTANPVIGTIASFEWIYSDNPFTSFSQNITRKTFENFGSYEVMHIVETSNGCRDTLTGIIDINPNPIVDF
jgi:hypothetical protein